MPVSVLHLLLAVLQARSIKSCKSELKSLTLGQVQMASNSYNRAGIAAPSY